MEKTGILSVDMGVSSLDGTRLARKNAGNPFGAATNFLANRNLKPGNLIRVTGETGKEGTFDVIHITAASLAGAALKLAASKAGKARAKSGKRRAGKELSKRAAKKGAAKKSAARKSGTKRTTANKGRAAAKKGWPRGGGAGKRPAKGSTTN